MGRKSVKKTFSFSGSVCLLVCLHFVFKVGFLLWDRRILDRKSFFSSGE